jgi:hypothetical protein
MRIAIDRYCYEEIYPAFKAATDEKAKTARINAAFLNSLADAGIVLTVILSRSLISDAALAIRRSNI